MDINIWNSKSDQVQSWRTQEWCNYFSFFFWISYPCFVLTVSHFGSGSVQKKEFHQCTPTRPRATSPFLWACTESKMASPQHPPPLAFWKPVYAAKNYSAALRGNQRHFEDLQHKTESPWLCLRASWSAVSKEREEERESASSTAGRTWEGLLQTVFKICLDYFILFFVTNNIFTHMCTPTHLCINFWLTGRLMSGLKDTKRRAATRRHWSQCDLFLVDSVLHFCY